MIGRASPRRSPAAALSGRFAARRALRSGVLFVWAGFFLYLLLSGEAGRYLGPRTLWVVPFGAVTLAIAAVAHAATARRAHPEPRPTRRELGSLVLVLMPVVVIAAVPRPQLGALAADRKSAGAGIAGSLLVPVPDGRGKLSFVDIHFAQESSEYAATIGIAEGTRMEVIGFVTHNPAGPGSFHLARFYVSCCAADAIPYAVAVNAGERDFPDDTWLGISGALARQDERWVLVAERVRLEQEPKDPYLY